MFEDGGRKADYDAGGKEQGHNDHGFCKKILMCGAQRGDYYDDKYGQKCFSEIYVVSEQLIQSSELKHISYEITRKQRDRRGVRPQYRKVCQGEKPGCQETVIRSEYHLAEGIGASGIRIDIHHVSIVEADDKHDNAAGQGAEHAAHGTRLCQISIAGDDEGAPADAGSDGKSPCGQWCQISGKMLAAHIDKTRLDIYAFSEHN